VAIQILVDLHQKLVALEMVGRAEVLEAEESQKKMMIQKKKSQLKLKAQKIKKIINLQKTVFLNTRRKQ
jgi:hypothetical protein